MKFQPDILAGTNTITRHDAQGIRVNEQAPIGHSVLVPWTGDPQPWGVAQFEALTTEHFAQALALGPEVIIFGSGARLRFPPAALLAAAMARRVGVETMDVPAACRTYNVLAAEGRKVVAALLLEPGR